MTCPRCGTQVETPGQTSPAACPGCGCPLPQEGRPARRTVRRPELFTVCLFCLVAAVLSALFGNFFLTCLFGLITLVSGALGLFPKS